jgi:hypothetical protein
MKYKVHPDLHWCMAGNHAIFLNLSSDRYFTIPTTWNDTFRKASEGADLDPGDPTISKLCRNAVLIQLASLSTPMPPVAELPPASEELRPSPNRRRSISLQLKGLWWQWYVSRALSRRGLYFLIRRLSRVSSKRPGPQLPLESYAALTGSFAHTNFFRTHADQCLVRSAGLLFLIRQFDPDVRLVIGVSSSPFSAHAWLQRDKVILNDTIDQVRAYTPIFVA